MEYEIIEETKEENLKFKDLLKDYKDLDIQIKELKLKQDKLKLGIFDLMEQEELDKFTNNFGTAYYAERFQYDKQKAIEYYLENDPSALEVEYKLKSKTEANLMVNKELDFGQGFNKIKQIRVK
jgi:predicted RNA-binding protein